MADNNTTPAQALSAVREYFLMLENDRAQFRDWAGGTADGGPNNDGDYPLTDFTGNVHTVPCPAKIAALAGGPQTPGISTGVLFVDLGTLTVSSVVQRIVTMGYNEAEVGRGVYKRTTNTGATRYRAQTADGAWWELDAPSPYVETFGAKGNNSSFDDAPAFLAAIEWNEARGGGFLNAEGSKTYYFSQTISIDPTLTGFNGNGCTLDWRLKNFLPFAGQAELLTNGSLDSGQTGWTVGGASTGAFDWTGGKVAMIQASSVANAKYFQFGQKVTAPVGTTLRVTVTVDFINTVQDAASGTPFGYLAIAFGKSNKALSAMAPFASKQVKNTESGYSAPMTLTFDATVMDASQVDPWIRFATNASVQISDISVKVVPNNYCIDINGKARQYGHNARFFGNFWLYGRSDQVQDVTAFRFNSRKPMSARGMFYNIRTEGPTVGNCLYFANGAYLCDFFACNLLGRFDGIRTMEDADDGGENINLHGCTLGAGQGAGINNSGMGFFLYGCSIDFPKQWYRGKGVCELHGCWLEKNAVLEPTTYVIEVLQGTVQIFGGRLQIDGPHTDVAPAPFYVGKDARLIMHRVVCSNLGSTDDVWAVGEGDFYSYGMLGGDRCPTIAMRRDERNAFPNGSFGPYIGQTTDSTVIGVDCWLDPGNAGNSANVQNDRLSLGWSNKGTITADSTQDNAQLTNVTGAGLAVPGDVLSGPGIVVGSTIITKGTGTINMHARAWKTQSAIALTYQGTALTGSASIALSTDSPRSGTQCLDFTKDQSTSLPVSMFIAFPLRAECKSAFEFWFRVRARALQGSETAGAKHTVYIQAYYAALLNNGSLRHIPSVGQRYFAGLDQTQVIDVVSGHKIWTFKGDTTNGQPYITNVNKNAAGNLGVGFAISGPNIPAGATITNIQTASTTISTTGSARTNSRTITDLASVAGIVPGMTLNNHAFPTGTIVSSVDATDMSMIVSLEATVDADDTPMMFTSDGIVTISDNATLGAAGQSFDAMSNLDWNKITFRSNDTSGRVANGVPPAYATHMLIQINAINARGLFKMSFDDMFASTY